jgi:hypothetical protein
VRKLALRDGKREVYNLQQQGILQGVEFAIHFGGSVAQDSSVFPTPQQVYSPQNATTAQPLLSFVINGGITGNPIFNIAGSFVGSVVITDGNPIFNIAGSFGSQQPSMAQQPMIQPIPKPKQLMLQGRANAYGRRRPSHHGGSITHGHEGRNMAGRHSRYGTSVNDVPQTLSKAGKLSTLVGEVSPQLHGVRDGRIVRHIPSTVNSGHSMYQDAVSHSCLRKNMFGPAN